jgi:TPR repeat protein
MEELTRQRAYNGNEFALSSFYFYGSLDPEGLVAAEKGEVRAMSVVGSFMYRGRELPKDLKKGDEYIRRAADLGDYIIIELYLMNRDKIDTDVLCYYVKKAYTDHGTSHFSNFLHNRPSDMLYLQNTCRVFNDKTYTPKEIPLGLINDMGDEEYFKMEKATFYSEREPIFSKQIFEELEDSKDIRLVSTAQLCLFRQHYLGVGVQRDFDKALEYLEKAYMNGNQYAIDAISFLENRHLGLDILPESYLLTDYTGVKGLSCFYNIGGLYNGALKSLESARKEMDEYYK